MKSSQKHAAAPPSTDLVGWRRVVQEGQYVDCRFEDIVAAIQDLGPHTDKVILHTLTKHLSVCIIRMLRGLVGRNKRNGGDDIIEEVHSQLWIAIFNPASADGKGLRIAFKPRVRFRVKDAILHESELESSMPETTDSADADNRGGQHEILARHKREGPTAAVPSILEPLDVDLLLLRIPDERKRLAFYLHRDRVPFKSTLENSGSIEQALGVSERTARAWVKEVQAFLKDNLGDAV